MLSTQIFNRQEPSFWEKAVPLITVSSCAALFFLNAFDPSEKKAGPITSQIHPIQLQDALSCMTIFTPLFATVFNTYGWVMAGLWCSQFSPPGALAAIESSPSPCIHLGNVHKVGRAYFLPSYDDSAELLADFTHKDSTGILKSQFRGDHRVKISTVFFELDPMRLLNILKTSSLAFDSSEKIISKKYRAMTPAERNVLRTLHTQAFVAFTYSNKGNEQLCKNVTYGSGCDSACKCHGAVRREVCIPWEKIKQAHKHRHNFSLDEQCGHQLFDGKRIRELFWHENVFHSSDDRFSLLRSLSLEELKNLIEYIPIVVNNRKMETDFSRGLRKVHFQAIKIWDEQIIQEGPCEEHLCRDEEVLKDHKEWEAGLSEFGNLTMNVVETTSNQPSQMNCFAMHSVPRVLDVPNVPLNG